MKPLYSGHPLGCSKLAAIYKGGLIIQCTFNREVLFGTLLGGCFRGDFLIQVCDMAALDRFHCKYIHPVESTGKCNKSHTLRILTISHSQSTVHYALSILHTKFVIHS